MKLIYLIILIILIGFIGSYFTLVSIAVGTHDLFNPVYILYFLSIVSQLAISEGNDIICLDACGPCSAYGPWHILIDGECVFPDSSQQSQRSQDIEYVSNQTRTSTSEAIIALEETSWDVEKAIKLIQQNKLK